MITVKKAKQKSLSLCNNHGGIKEGKIRQKDMSYQEFYNLCSSSVYPAYENQVKSGVKTTFAKVIAEDNYEQPVMQPGDKPTIVTASEHQGSMLRSAAYSSYSMKAGDILVCYGTNSLTGFPGHEAIATSKGWVLEMQSPGHKTKHTSKKDFF